MAVDGGVLRLRLPGGRITSDALRAVGRLAAKFGDGALHLTSRANLQLRGVRVDAVTGSIAEPELITSVLATGLVPSTTHERVRNILCSPLTGISGGLADLRALTAELDARICAEPDLANLAGRFLFGLDDGRGDLDGVSIDLGVRADGPRTARLRIGELLGPQVSIDTVGERLIQLAREFQRLRANRWRVNELPDGGRELCRATDPLPDPRQWRMPLGVIPAQGGSVAISATAPLGLLDDAGIVATCAVAAAGTGEVVITPWRGIVIPGLEPARADVLARKMASAGWILDPDSELVGVTACTGAPGCSHAAAETHSLAIGLAQVMVTGTAADRLPAHVVGCERQCGAPAGTHVEVLATPAGARVSPRHGVRTAPPNGVSAAPKIVSAAALPAAVAEARRRYDTAQPGWAASQGRAQR